MKKTIMLCMSLMCMLSCREELETPDVYLDGMKPVYLTLDPSLTVASIEAQAFDNLGKIVSRENYIYINERFKGIHVIDNSDPRNPITKYFWQIDGNIDFTLRGDFLYADNSEDLLTINVADPASINLVSKVEGIFKNENERLFPPDYFGPFECADPTKGSIVDWEMSSLLNPQCQI